MRAEEARIQSFLKFGYFIDYGPPRHPLDYSRIDKARYAGTSRSELVEIGLAKLRETFASAFEPGRDHVVPLSGGLDSRLILGALFELADPATIRTYTYGVPGTYDYEIGCMVAKHAGTRHMAYPLDGISYHEDELLAFARHTDCQAILFYAPPFWEIERRYRNSVLWSGYVGDVVAGSHVHDVPSPNLDAARRFYLGNRRVVKSTALHNCSDDDLVPFVGYDDADPAKLTYDEQVFFGEAYKLIEPLLLLQGFDIKTPFINSPWMDFMMSVPNSERLDESLMIEIANRAFPRLFELPAKNTRGLGWNASKSTLKLKRAVDRGRKLAHRFLPSVVDRCILYNDFNEGIRQSPDLRRIILDNASALKRRGIVDWVDIDALIQRHLRRRGNHGDALMVLASLELVHRARESTASSSG
jgi:hypothetical protein